LFGLWFFCPVDLQLDWWYWYLHLNWWYWWYLHLNYWYLLTTLLARTVFALPPAASAETLAPNPAGTMALVKRRVRLDAHIRLYIHWRLEVGAWFGAVVGNLFGRLLGRLLGRLFGRLFSTAFSLGRCWGSPTVACLGCWIVLG
jgi:hypothetical protein